MINNKWYMMKYNWIQFLWIATINSLKLVWMILLEIWKSINLNELQIKSEFQAHYVGYI